MDFGEMALLLVLQNDASRSVRFVAYDEIEVSVGLFGLVPNHILRLVNHVDALVGGENHHKSVIVLVGEQLLRYGVRVGAGRQGEVNGTV